MSTEEKRDSSELGVHELLVAFEEHMRKTIAKYYEIARKDTQGAKCSLYDEQVMCLSAAIGAFMLEFTATEMKKVTMVSKTEGSHAVSTITNAVYPYMMRCILIVITESVVKYITTEKAKTMKEGQA